MTHNLRERAKEKYALDPAWTRIAAQLTVKLRDLDFIGKQDFPATLLYENKVYAQVDGLTFGYASSIIADPREYKVKDLCLWHRNEEGKAIPRLVTSLMHLGSLLNSIHPAQPWPGNVKPIPVSLFPADIAELCDDRR